MPIEILQIKIYRVRANNLEKPLLKVKDAYELDNFRKKIAEVFEREIKSVGEDKILIQLDTKEKKE
jgi:hypothetical protein